MSTCISRHGEYGNHVLAGDFVCERCFVLDEDALIADRDQWRARAEAAEKAVQRVRAHLKFLLDIAEQEHTHPEGEGEQECPGCWREEVGTLLRTLDGEE